MKYMRITEPGAWGRMDWVQEASMPFHFQLNAMYMLFRTHLGESDNDPSCLDRHRARLQRYKLDKKKPEFNRARELAEQSLVARLLDITRFGSCQFQPRTRSLTNRLTRIILKFETMEELYKWKPKWSEFNGVVHTIVDEYSMAPEADPSLGATDEVLRHSKLFIRDMLIFWVFSDAVRHEDVGLMWLVYTFWLFMFRGAGCHNYGGEILEMVAQFRYEMNEQLQRVTERTWLVNQWGKQGRAIPTDLYLEHNNGFIKVWWPAELRKRLIVYYRIYLRRWAAALQYPTSRTNAPDLWSSCEGCHVTFRPISKLPM